MKTFLYLLLLTGLHTLAFAQKKPAAIKPYTSEEAKDAGKEADAYFKALNYPSALKMFERLVLTEPGNADYNYKLGMCYLLTNTAKHKAVSYLEFAANSNEKNKPKDVLFDLGKAYHYAGLYDKAIETYEAFRLQKGGSVDSKLKFNMWVDWSHNAKKLAETPVACTFSNLGKSINSNQADYRPLMGAADTIVYFSSKRKGTVGGLTDDLGESPSDVYFFTQNDTSRSKVKNAGITVNTEYYEETMFLSMNGDRMLIYREGPESNGDIYLADLQGKSWAKPVLLGKDFQTKVLETGATLSPDGLTLYFAAEAMDGKTGKDIYRCTRTESTSWSKPEKLSGPINTDLDEDNPVLWLDGKTLFFSSTGHQSMGGLDIFRSYMADPSEGFGKIENLGYPINSVYDDYNLALACDGKSAYVSAVRDSGIGDYDIYKVTFEKPVVTQPLCWIQGKGITNVGTPAKGAFVVVTDAVSGATVANLEANEASGRFDVALPPGTYKVVLKHAKAGKAETQVTVEPGTSKVVVNLVFP
ncbi:MAG: PD40 domain-containing protein [Bacteroidia bacterium]|nr:PD40 domain-containing protein [Bacteroidia bacterium]